MKRLIVALLLLASGPLFAQSYHVYDVIWLATGKPANHSPVRICAANATGSPCSPLATIYSDQALTVPLAQPIFSDAIGNYDFWVASPATYIVEYYPQGSPIPLHKILTAPNTGPSQSGQNGQDGAPGAPGYSPNQITSGCGFVWVTGLTWDVAACNYIIQNAPYSSPATRVTGPASDPSLDRFDAIVVDKTGAVSIVAGTPSANPAPPSLDISSQLMITFYRVDAGATSPANIVNIDLYHENAEWTCTGSATVNCASTTNPHSGNLDIAFAASPTGAYARLTAPAGTIDLNDSNYLSFWISPSASWAGASLSIQWFNGTTAKCTAVSLADGNFNFNSGSSSYQLITIPTSLFNCGGVAVNRVQFLRTGAGSTNFYLDDVVLQGGITNSSGNLGMYWKGTWSSTAAYKVQDTVFRNGSSYVALTDSSGLAPESNPTAWQVMDTHGPAGVDGNLQIKAGFAFGSINTTWDPATQTLTFPGKIVATELDSNATTGQGLFLDGATSPVLSSAGGISFISNGGVCQISQNGGAYAPCSSAFGGAAAGSTQDVQYNNAGSFAADTGHFDYNSSTHTLSVDSLVVGGATDNGLEIVGASGQTVSAASNIKFISTSTGACQVSQNGGSFRDCFPYVMATFLEPAPTASQVVLRHVIPVPVDVATNCATSKGGLGSAATASTVFTLLKNGVSFGTATFGASGTTATFSCTHTTFAAGDIVTVTAPASPDATANKLSLSIYGTRY